MTADITFAGCLLKSAERLKIPISGASVSSLGRYFELLKTSRERKNLIGPLDDAEICEKLFIDSLLGLLFLPPEAGLRVLDIGCGAGFPGLVLKIARPDIHLSLLDSAGKKIRFTQHVCAQLGLENVSFYQERAELLAHDPAIRESFDIVTAKAFAPLPVLLELAAPFASKGGKVCAWKGIHVRTELAELGDAHAQLGLGKPDVREFALPQSDIPTFIVLFEKMDRTPDRFPRSHQAITRKPLVSI